MTEYRLVVQMVPHHWGSEGLEFTERYYVLQVRRRYLAPDGRPATTSWSTVPSVDFNTLLDIEQKEIHATLLQNQNLR
jgi:hypothetical protein